MLDILRIFRSCVSLCINTILHRCQQRPRKVGIPMIQLPEESLPHFPVNITRFPADKVMNPPRVLCYRI